MYAISLNNISKKFLDDPQKPFLVLKNVTINIKDGEFVVFLGPSGCGKSTLLRIASGLERDFSGQVDLGGGINKTDFGFVFQQFALLPWLTVFENVALGLRSRPMDSSAITKKVEEELKIFSLNKFAKSYPKNLSGGMKQRVGLARALAVDPKIMFLDEPFSELDSFTSEKLRQELLSVWQERKMTVVMVSHNIEEALELADKIAVITSRPGEVKEVIDNTLSRPRNKRSSEFYALYDRIYSLIEPQGL